MKVQCSWMGSKVGPTMSAMYGGALSVWAGSGVRTAGTLGGMKVLKRLNHKLRLWSQMAWRLGR